MSARIAIVGAGMAGAACAAALRARGSPVTLFDKGRAPGGRLAQRRVDGHRFDHGAQYLKAREPRFRALVESWVAAGCAARWLEADTDGELAWIGVPSMSTPVKALLGEAELHLERRVERLERADRAWRLRFADGSAEGPFDTLVLAVPAPQAAELLASLADAAAAELRAQLAAVAMAPCWAAMVALPQRLDVPFESWRAPGGALAWVARHGSKPGRSDGGGERWTIHAGPDWSQRHLEAPAEAVAPALLDAFALSLGIGLPTPLHLSAHRWRYALVERALGRPFLHAPSLGLALCGDWCLGPRIEAAWRSGTVLGEALPR